MMNFTANRGEPSAGSAAWCERAIAMLGAGLPSRRVIAALGEPPRTTADGGAVWIAWSLAVHSGAALTTVLEACAIAARDWERIAGERATALAGPRAAAKLVTALPVVALLLGMAFGLNTFGFVFTSMLGWVLLLIGFGALWGGMRWNRTLMLHAAESEPAPGFACEMTAQLIASGVTVLDAVRRVDEVWSTSERDGEARGQALELARATGMPPVRALRAEAAAQRAAESARASERASELGVKLTLPLGVCVLPAFICWGVLPLVFTVIGTAVTESAA